eukprot:892846-Prorocentrum_minimum.AAC.1
MQAPGYQNFVMLYQGFCQRLVKLYQGLVKGWSRFSKVLPRFIKVLSRFSKVSSRFSQVYLDAAGAAGAVRTAGASLTLAVNASILATRSADSREASYFFSTRWRQKSVVHFASWSSSSSACGEDRGHHVITHKTTDTIGNTVVTYSLSPRVTGPP